MRRRRLRRDTAELQPYLKKKMREHVLTQTTRHAFSRRPRKKWWAMREKMEPRRQYKIVIFLLKPRLVVKFKISKLSYQMRVLEVINLDEIKN